MLEWLGAPGATIVEQGVAIAFHHHLFHHHMGSMIEKAEETDRLRAGGNPDLLNIEFREEMR
ncbi:MAG TPA: hypothetical protein VG848_11085 [Acetobacteraceae bacterium]|nr:hypothetical protein [Acetobacteraceae bacterium]